MSKRHVSRKASCPIARAADVFGDCWSMLIIRDAMMGCAASAIPEEQRCRQEYLTVRLRALVAKRNAQGRAGLGR